MYFTSKITGCLLLLGLIVGEAAAQKDPFKFGKITKADLEAIADEKFPEAAAVVLGDYGVTRFGYSEQYGWRYQMQRTRRIKIYNKEGYDQANIELPFYEGTGGSEEQISGLKAYTYNLENGQEVKYKLDNKETYKEQLSDHWYKLKFALTNVKEGSIIEYSYTITSDYISNLYSWRFQDEIPVRYSEYRVTIPEYFHYQNVFTGYERLTVNESETISENFTIDRSDNSTISSISKHYRWVGESLPAIRREPYMTTPEDYYTQIQFQLNSIKYPNAPVKNYMGSYDGQFNETLLKSDNLGMKVKRSGFADDIVASLKANKPETTMQNIYEHVKYQMNWNNYYSIYTQKSLRQVYKEGNGSVADINLLLCALLNEAGIESHPVVLSTRSNGKPHPFFPVISKFNYLIAAAIINDQLYLMDATNKNLPLDVLPERVLNGKGWMVAENNAQWVKLEGKSGYHDAISVKINYGTDGTALAVIDCKRDGILGCAKRADYFSKGEEAYVTSYKEKLKDWELIKAEFPGNDNIYESFTEHYELEGEAQLGANIIYVSPIMFGGITENIFKTEERKFPVDIPTTFRNTYMMEMEVPEGYTINEQPQSAVFALPENAAVFRYNVVRNGNKLMLISQTSINKTIFLPEEYPNLRKFYELIVAKHGEQIILKKL